MQLRALKTFGAADTLHSLESLRLEFDRRLVLVMRDETNNVVTLEVALCRAVYRVDLACAFMLDGVIGAAVQTGDAGRWVFEVFDSVVQRMFEEGSGNMGENWHQRCFLVSLDADHIFILSQNEPRLDSVGVDEGKPKL